MPSPRRSEPRLTAATADRHVLYQESVQAPGFEVAFTSWVYERRVGRRPLTLREDFCGTGILCAHWVASDPRRVALGVDLDPSVLAWGREHLLGELEEDEAARVTLLEGDVRDAHPARHDVLVALNYSYFCFKTRAELLRYFRAARAHLAEDGLLFLDLFGGWEAQQVMADRREVEGFHYVWDQVSFDPISADLLAHIHFEFGDGSALRRAFTYDWRLWTLRELRELLEEAGFEDVEVLWEGEDEDGEGNGEFHPMTRVENDPSFNAYLVARAG